MDMCVFLDLLMESWTWRVGSMGVWGAGLKSLIIDSEWCGSTYLSLVFAGVFGVLDPII